MLDNGGKKAKAAEIFGAIESKRLQGLILVLLIIERILDRIIVMTMG